MVPGAGPVRVGSRIGRCWREGPGRDDRGQSLIVFILALPVLIAIFGLVLGIDRVYVVRTNVQDDASLAVAGGAQSAAAMAAAGSGTELGTTSSATSVVISDGLSSVRATFAANLAAAHLSADVASSAVSYLAPGSANPCQAGAVIRQPSFALTGKGVVKNMGFTAAAFGVGSVRFRVCEVAAITQNSEAAS